jgi:hypothetical protein
LAHNVFISHSTKDKEIAAEICAALEADGISCWIAPRDIKPGEEWPVAIVKAVTCNLLNNYSSFLTAYPALARISGMPLTRSLSITLISSGIFSHSIR